ncbi:hypothetical protein QQP08_005994 [Theobroma cacao]|nr:hypothetical protein QQP08_005994 [Theobroma cacao]
MTRQQQNHLHQDQQSRVFYELSALVLSLLRSPLTPMPFSDHSPAPARRPHPPSTSTSTTISPAGFAWLMLGISVSLMLCGSVTFFIGFMLMPWILCLVMVFYVAGIVSTVSMLGRSILCYAMAPPSPRKDIPGNVDNSCFKMLLKYVDMVSLSSRSSDLSKDLTDHVYCILICEKKWEDCFPFLSYIQFLSGLGRRGSAQTLLSEVPGVPNLAACSCEFCLLRLALTHSFALFVLFAVSVLRILWDSVDVNTYGDEEDGDKSKEDYSVDKNRYPTGLHVPELHHFAPSWQLKQQPWT